MNTRTRRSGLALSMTVTLSHLPNSTKRQPLQMIKGFIRARREASVFSMTETQTAPDSGFTPGERAYIRGELDIFFSTLPSVAEGFQLKTWRGGPDRGKPKISPVARGLLERGLMLLDTGERLPRLVFTETGLAALRAMMRDRRLADPMKFAHVRQELGIGPGPETDAPHD
jgi:hypothetical protein